MLESYGLKVKPKREEFEYKKPKYDAFKVMYSAFQKNYDPTDEEIKRIPEFLFHNILSNNENTLDLALFFTSFNVPIEIQYKLVKMLPKVYIPYPKKTKEQEEISMIKKYYNCDDVTAKKYRELLSKEQIKEIENVVKIKIKMGGKYG